MSATVKPGEFIVAGPGGPGESEELQCPVPGCWWTDQRISGSTLDDLLAVALEHIADRHSELPS